MRLERIVPAVAIILFLSTLPNVASEGVGSVAIVAPTEGAAVGPRERVTLEVAGMPSLATIYGYLTLDGEWAGSFTAMPMPGPDARRFNATLNATGFASGAHVLSAVAYTNESGPVEAPPVSVMLDLPPVVTAIATYDLDARALRVSVTVEDEGPTPPTLNLSEKNVSVERAFIGMEELVLAIRHGPGSYAAQLNVKDARGQNASVRLAYEVRDRAATLEVLEATYVVGGRLLLRAAGDDLDGGLRSILVRTPLGNGALRMENGTWVGNVSLNPRLGTHNATLVAEDAYLSRTTLDFTFTIAGPREVVFERTITTTAGSYSNVDADIYLPRVHEGMIEICVNACGNDTIYVWPRSAVVVAAIEARTPDGARTTCIAYDRGQTCTFDTRAASGWPLDLAWQQNGDLTVTVRVSGVRV